MERLTGYTFMIVWKFRLCGNTKRIHPILIPQTPTIVKSAGTNEMPKPLI